MAAEDLVQADFDLAFSFVRGEPAAYRAAGGISALADLHQPRFDHGEDGTPRGLLVTSGSDLGLEDRTTVDPLMLPVALVSGVTAEARACTVYHAFRPDPVDGDDASWQAGVVRQAWYSRDAVASINALLAQSGNHLEIGVVAGFRANLGGFVRLRGAEWQLAGLLTADGAALLHDGADRPIVTAGAELPYA